MSLRRSDVLKTLAVAPFAVAARPASAQTAPVRIGFSPTDAGISPYYAQEQGFFSKAHVDVELHPFFNSLAMMEAVAGNALDVGFADALQIGTAYLRGIPLAFFAGAAVYTSAAPTVLLCVSKNGSIKTAKDLEGQVVGTIALNGSLPLATQAWLNANGADASKVKMFELPFPQMAAALERGTIAAAGMIEPFITFARDDLRVLGKPMDIFGKQFTVDLWFTSRDWAARNPDLLKRLTGARYEAGRWSNDKPADSLQSLVKLAKLDPDRVRAMNRFQWATSLDPGMLQPVLDLGYKYKQLDKPIAARELIIAQR
jgi:NitT/TauT family transport system substrate-binding protein